MAAFARAGAPLAVALQLTAAVVCAGSFGRSAKLAWFPAITTAADSLPESEAAIRQGRLRWPDSGARVLGATRQLSIAVTPAGAMPSQGGDLQIELAPDALRLRGLAGFVDAAYPVDLVVALDRINGRATWEAWSWVVQLALAAACGLTLVTAWWLGAALEAPLLWVAAMAARKELTLGGAWRVASTAWVVPALFLAGAMQLYGGNRLGFQSMVAVIAAHAAAGPAWSTWAFCRLPSRAPAPPNPFQGGAAAQKSLTVTTPLPPKTAARPKRRPS